MFLQTVPKGARWETTFYCCTAGSQRISTTIRSSQKRQDDLHIELEKRLIEDKHLTIKCHRGCILSYTSNSHIQRHALDFDFLKRVITEPNTPEYGGLNTKLSREQGQSAQPATRAIYTPLMDMTPSRPGYHDDCHGTGTKN